MRRGVLLKPLLIALACGALAGGPEAARAQDASVTVVDFYNLSQDARWEWLSRGLADMLITDLSSVSQLRIVDREGLKQYLDELELRDNGVLSDEIVMDIGRLAGVDHVIFGTYHVDRDGEIEVRATIVDVHSGRARAAVALSRTVSDVLALEKDLAARLVDEFEISLSARDRQNLAFVWTESLDATAHFYTALGHYDDGELPLALAESKVAEKIDPDYLPARFWTGRLYIELAEYEHAELYLARFLADAASRQYKPAYVVHGSLLLAQLYAKFLATPVKAIPVLEGLRRDTLDSFERANINFQLASLYRQAGQYHRAYDLFVSVYEQSEGLRLVERFRIPYRGVALMPSLRDLRAMAIENYQSCFLLAYYHSDTLPEPQPEMVMLTADAPEFRRTETFQGAFSYDRITPKPMFVAPKGQRFRAFTLEFRGKQADISIHPLLHQNARFDLIGQKENMPAPKGGLSRQRYDAHQEMVQAFFFNAYVKDQPEGKFSWRVTAEFMPVRARQPGSVEYWHDLLRRNVRYPILFDTPGHTGEKTAMTEGHGEELWIVYDTFDREETDERGKDSDLWLIATRDKATWEGPKPIAAVNSVGNDFDPVLFRDERRRLVLAFASDRGGDNALWLAMSADGRYWQRPRRLVVRDADGAELRSLTTPALFLDDSGVYRLAAFRADVQKLVFSASKDLLHWDEARIVDLPEMKPAGGWGEKVTLDYLQDGDGLYRLIVSPNFFYDTHAYLGTSADAEDWTVYPAGFAAHGHPSVVHGDDGRFALMLTSAVDAAISEYPIHYAFQLSSKDWRHWGLPVALPRIHYLADYHMKPSTIYQDRDGFYWIANHRHYGEQFQLYRVEEFPVRTIGDAFPPIDNAHPYARNQLAREELVRQAMERGDEELASCLRSATHYRSCLKDETGSAGENGWWRWW